MPMRMSRKDSDLWKSVLTGAKRRWGRMLTKELKARLWAEMSVYGRVGASEYLALLRDVCREVRSHGCVVGAGRGAAVGSAVCYALGITGVDPIRHRLTFERFMCGCRNEFPDVDLEFDRAGRELARDYLVSRFGADYVAHIMYQIPKIGSRLGLSVHPFAVAISGIPFDRQFSVLSVDGARLDSQHKNLALLYADRNQAEKAGIRLIDLVPQDGLTRIGRVLGQICRNGLLVPDMDNLPLNDARVLRLFHSGRTSGISGFDDVETRRALRRAAPASFGDIVVFQATEGKKDCDVDEVSREHCEDTEGRLVFQEQLDSVIADLAGVSFKSAELIRRRLHRGLNCAVLANVKERRHLEELAKRDLAMKSHAVSRAYLGYQQAYLKAHYPACWKYGSKELKRRIAQ